MKTNIIKVIHDLVEPVQTAIKFLKTNKLYKNENDKKQARNKKR